MIYLVGQGSHNHDYRIVTAFSDEAIATAHVEEWNELGGEERMVEPFVILQELPKLTVIYSASWSNWRGTYSGSGDDEVHLAEAVAEPEDLPGDLDSLRVYNYTDDGSVVDYSCYSFDPERPAKIVSDARAKHLARSGTVIG